MIDPWFSIETAQNLKWLLFLVLLSFLVTFPLLGRMRRAMTTIWTIGVASGVLCLGAFIAAQIAAQPSYVVSPLFAMGIALTLAFGATFWPMRRAYREVEIRKTIARDI